MTSYCGGWAVLSLPGSRRKLQVRGSIQGKGQQPQHHARFRFRGVSSQRQGEVAVDLTVQVRDVQIEFVDSRFQSHDLHRAERRASVDYFGSAVIMSLGNKAKNTPQPRALAARASTRRRSP